MDIWVIWLVIAGVLFVIEMLTLTFYLLWLGIGALTALVVALAAPDAVLFQVLAGCAAAIALTVFSKPLTRRIRASKGFSNAYDDIIGKEGIVTEGMGQGEFGIVKIGADTWSATSKKALKKNDRVIVIHRRSTILEVDRAEGE